MDILKRIRKTFPHFDDADFQEAGYSNVASALEYYDRDDDELMDDCILINNIYAIKNEILKQRRRRHHINRRYRSIFVRGEVDNFVLKLINFTPMEGDNLLEFEKFTLKLISRFSRINHDIDSAFGVYRMIHDYNAKLLRLDIAMSKDSNKTTNDFNENPEYVFEPLIRIHEFPEDNILFQQ